MDRENCTLLTHTCNFVVQQVRRDVNLNTKMKRADTVLSRLYSVTDPAWREDENDSGNRWISINSTGATSMQTMAADVFSWSLHLLTHLQLLHVHTSDLTQQGCSLRSFTPQHTHTHTHKYFWTMGIIQGAFMGEGKSQHWVFLPRNNRLLKQKSVHCWLINNSTCDTPFCSCTDLHLKFVYYDGADRVMCILLKSKALSVFALWNGQCWHFSTKITPLSKPQITNPIGCWKALKLGAVLDKTNLISMDFFEILLCHIICLPHYNQDSLSSIRALW
jgi:hypothetical protein